MRNAETMTRLAEKLAGKTFTASSLQREIDRIIPNAWVCQAPIPGGKCLYAEKDGISLVLFLDRTEKRTKYRVRQARVEEVVEPDEIKQTKIRK